MSKISAQVGDNEVSLKQVLDGQNFMAQLLMRCLNSDSDLGNITNAPSNFQSMLSRGHAMAPGPFDTRMPMARAQDSHEKVVGPEAVDPPVVPSSAAPLPDSTPVAAARSAVLGESTASPENERTVDDTEAPSTMPEVNVVTAAAYIPTHEESPPSWMSGSTVLITPSMDLRRPGERSVRSPSAISTDISDSIRTPSVTHDPLQPFLDIYFGEDTSWRKSRESERERKSPSECTPIAPPTFAEAPRVHTRAQANADLEVVDRRERHSERIRHGLLMMPRLSEDPVACNKPVYILHPDHPDKVVAEGKSGGSWKARTQKLGHLCAKGEQMVQVHVINIQKCRLLHVEERQAFKVLDDAVVKKTGSTVFVKWSARYLVRIRDT